MCKVKQLQKKHNVDVKYTKYNSVNDKPRLITQF